MKTFSNYYDKGQYEKCSGKVSTVNLLLDEVTKKLKDAFRMKNDMVLRLDLVENFTKLLYTKNKDFGNEKKNKFYITLGKALKSYMMFLV